MRVIWARVKGHVGKVERSKVTLVISSLNITGDNLFVFNRTSSNRI